MNKYTKIAIVAAFALIAFPGAALAHNGGDKADVRGDDRGGWDIKPIRPIRIARHSKAGMVIALQTTGFTLKAKDDTTYTVLIAGAKLTNQFGKTILPADIKVNDSVVVVGTLNDTTLTAASVLDMPANTHRAQAKGTITAVSGNTVTLQTNNQGVISNVTVKTSADTMIKKSDGTVGTSADLTVGSKVRVKGLWDEVLNVLNAISVKLRIK